MITKYAIAINKFISKSNTILQNIPEDIKTTINNLMIERTYSKGQNIFLEGSYPAGVYFLKEGLIKKYKTDHGGKDHILYLCTQGELLGYSALLCEETYPDSAAALETSKVGFIPKETFLSIIADSNILMQNILSCLSHEFGVLVNSVTVFAHMSVRERLSLILLILYDKFSYKSGNKNGEILLSREDLASMVGTATETLIRLLYDFKKNKIIELDGKKIIIKNTKLLLEISKFY